MASDSLKRTVDNVLEQTRVRMTAVLDQSLAESQKRLAGSLQGLEAEYDRILSDGRKEADKIEKHIIGSSDLEARNRHLLTVEEAVDRVFKEALDRISGARRDASYRKLIGSLLDEVAATLGSSGVVLYTNDTDRKVLLAEMERYPEMSLSEETISCLGGIMAKSADGSMAFDNTLDARISRLKPLIRKQIADKFGVTG